MTANGNTGINVQQLPEEYSQMQLSLTVTSESVKDLMSRDDAALSRMGELTGTHVTLHDGPSESDPPDQKTITFKGTAHRVGITSESPESHFCIGAGRGCS